MLKCGHHRGTRLGEMREGSEAGAMTPKGPEREHVKTPPGTHTGGFPSPPAPSPCTGYPGEGPNSVLNSGHSPAGLPG